MSDILRQRVWDLPHAFDHPVTLWATVAVAALLVLSPLVVLLLSVLGRLTPAHRTELLKRIGTWAILAPVILGPILLGPMWTILAVGVLGLLCYQEYARATGLFREKTISLLVVLGILAITFAAADDWYNFFMALGPLTVAIIAAAAILADRPKGYIQRVALGVLAFVLFGLGLGHLGYTANDPDYRPILVLIILSVELNDVFAYITGKMLGRRKLCPNTSPNKTVAGAVGALVLTTALVAVLGHFVFADGPLDRPVHLITLGLLVSVGGQLGDLMLSSIKRDIGIKDLGVTLPGHGGLLDRFDSLLLVAPAVFHYVGYFRGLGDAATERIFTGGAG